MFGWLQKLGKFLFHHKTEIGTIAIITTKGDEKVIKIIKAEEAIEDVIKELKK